MARTRTAEDLVLDIRRRANLENSEFVTDDEVLEIFNQEAAELHAHITANEGQHHLRSSFTINVTTATLPATPIYDLPPDFWSLQEMSASIGGIWRSLEPFMDNERARLLNAQLYAYSASPQYRIQAGQVEFLPGTQAYTVQMFYTPASIRLELNQNPPQTFDGYDGYEVAAIYGSVATLREKEETDPSFYQAQKDRILKHIDSMAARRDGSHPERVTDVVGLTNILPLFPWE